MSKVIFLQITFHYPLIWKSRGYVANSGVMEVRDKTMDYKLIYISNNYIQNYPICRRKKIWLKILDTAMCLVNQWKFNKSTQSWWVHQYDMVLKNCWYHFNLKSDFLSLPASKYAGSYSSHMGALKYVDKSHILFAIYIFQ